MIEHSWTIICSRALVEKGTEKISLIDIFDGVTVTLPPNIPTPVLTPCDFNVVTQWRRTRATEAVRRLARTRIVDSSGADLGRFEIDVDLSARDKTRTIAVSKLLPISSHSSESIYEFVVELQEPDGTWSEKSRVGLLVKVHQPPPSSQTGSG